MWHATAVLVALCRGAYLGAGEGWGRWAVCAIGDYRQTDVRPEVSMVLSFDHKVLPLWITLLILGCTPAAQTVQGGEPRYRVQFLDRNLNPDLLRGPDEVDLDGDGTADLIEQNDTSIQVGLSGGGVFHYSLSEMAEDSATKVEVGAVLSLDRSGSYPSLILATLRDPAGAIPALIHQQVIFNDHGNLSLKTLSDFPVNARDVDCAWLGSNDLPVCFYASYGPDLGRSKLVEIDPSGIRQMARDTAYLNFRYRVSALYDGWASPGQANAREYTAERRGVSLQTVDSLIEAGWVDGARFFVDSVRALHFGLIDDSQMYSADITREYRLPWPVEPSRAYDRNRHPEGRWMDGYFMVESVFFDFSGDGLLDLVSVGQHSGVFSAVQHPDGYFVDAGYHGLADDYHKVRAPSSPGGSGVIPPCVLYSMEEDSAARSDYLECYDQDAGEWYEVILPGGPYYTDYLPVAFEDIDRDGVLDLAIMRKDSTWAAFAFVPNEGL